MHDEPRHAQLRTAIHLCRGTYCVSAAPDLPPLEVICEVVAVNGSAYAWLDGLSYSDPILVPVASLGEVRSIGTFREFMSDERNLDLPGFDSLLNLIYRDKASATVAARALEIMHAEGIGPEQALSSAVQWGVLITDIDAADRAAHGHGSSESTSFH